MKKSDLEHIIATLALHDFLLAQIVVNPQLRELDAGRWDFVSKGLIDALRFDLARPSRHKPHLTWLNEETVALFEEFRGRIREQFASE